MSPQSTAPRPQVSIVIPCYNQAAYLRQAIESVLAQHYAPLELIVVDDGSSDGSRELMRQYRERCTVIAQENAGQANAINPGSARSCAPVRPGRPAEPLEVREEFFRLGRAPREFAEAKDEALSSARLLAARLHLRSGRFAEALRLLWPAAKLDPANFRRLRTWHP